MSTILDQLKSIKDQLARSDKAAANLDADGRREAASLAHAIMFEVEDPGNLVDRIIYQVRVSIPNPKRKEKISNLSTQLPKNRHTLTHTPHEKNSLRKMPSSS